jgi:hypothetical protein
MAAACWASLAVLAGGIVRLYALEWHKSRKQIRKPTKSFLTKDDHTTKEAVAEQVA